MKWRGAAPTENFVTTIEPGNIKLFNKNYLGVDSEAMVQAGQMSIVGPFHKAVMSNYALDLFNEGESMHLSKAGLSFSGKEEVVSKEQGVYRRKTRFEIAVVDDVAGGQPDSLGNRLSVYDATGRLRATLGRTKLRNSVGLSMDHPEGTLALFGEDGKVELLLPKR